MINENGVSVEAVDPNEELTDDVFIDGSNDIDEDFEEFIADNSANLPRPIQKFHFNDLIFCLSERDFFRVINCTTIFEDEECNIVSRYEYTCQAANGGLFNALELDLFSVNETINNAIHLYFLQQLFNAQDRNVGGEFDVRIRASGSLNSKEVKISAEADVGNWDNRGTHKAPTLDRAVSVAIDRYWENKADEPKLLTVR